jgi:uncharacterized protein
MAGFGMDGQTSFDQAVGGRQEVADDWMAATGIRDLALEDPVLVWLKYHGRRHGFEPDTSPYEFADFIFEKGRQFGDKWIREMAPAAARVCDEATEVRRREKVRQTWALMQEGVPLIFQPALWWAPERIYGVPDLVAHTSWVQRKFPGLLPEPDPAHYVVFDHKFTTKLDSPGSGKKRDLAAYAGQVRMYSYMLGRLQERMPTRGFLVTRDRIFDPLAVLIESSPGGTLDSELARLRDTYVDIKLNGGDRLPWRDDRLAPNLTSTKDAPWHTAKLTIARDRIPGGDPSLVYQIGPRAKADLARHGFATLQSLLDAEPQTIPLEKAWRLGGKTARRIRAILDANRHGRPVRPARTPVPPRRTHELHVDFEFFSNVNVDFETQWPTLEGRAMTFMIGVGWERDGQWMFASFAAPAHEERCELEIFERFLAFLTEHTHGAFADRRATALYHWTRAEARQMGSLFKRHDLARDHPLRSLPWVDLQKPFHAGPVAIPGAWGFGLKEMATALGAHDAEHRVEWPGDLDAGLRAMVMGWRAYESLDPLETAEMKMLNTYLETDCKALWQMLRWLRESI